MFLPRHQSGRGKLIKLRYRKLLVMIPYGSRAIDDPGAAALRQLQQVRAVDILHVKWRVLAHHHRVKFLQRHLLRFACAVPPMCCVSLSGQLQRTRKPYGFPVAPYQIPLLDGKQMMTAESGFAHHRKARVFVGLD